MNVTRVQLPNGDLLRIEGGEAQNIANVITNHLARNVPLERPLEMPAMDFSNQNRAAVEVFDGETPLVAPTMNFDR